jgi:hypothetical protein
MSAVADRAQSDDDRQAPVTDKNVLSYVNFCRSCRRPDNQSHRQRTVVAIQRSIGERSLVFGVLNVQSLLNKLSSMYGCVVSDSSHIFAAAETWHKSAISPSINASTPPGYQVLERVRPRTGEREVSMCANHGGLCALIRSTISAARVVDFPTFVPLELLPLFIRINTLSAIVVIIYRPGSATVTENVLATFLMLWKELISYANCFIVGDINIHFDDLHCSHSTPVTV